MLGADLKERFPCCRRKREVWRRGYCSAAVGGEAMIHSTIILMVGPNKRYLAPVTLWSKNTNLTSVPNSDVLAYLALQHCGSPNRLVFLFQMAVYIPNLASLRKKNITNTPYVPIYEARMYPKITNLTSKI